MSPSGPNRWKSLGDHSSHLLVTPIKNEQFLLIFRTLSTAVMSLSRTPHVGLTALIQPVVIKVGSRPSSRIDLHNTHIQQVTLSNEGRRQWRKGDSIIFRHSGLKSAYIFLYRTIHSVLHVVTHQTDTHNFYAHLNLSFPPQREQVRSLLTNATQSHFQRYSQPQEALCQRAVHLSDRRRSHRGWKKMEGKDTGRFTQSYGYVGREQGQWRKK